ncbi:hypothetical protein Tco_1474672 [Tanacetum coccineum]
MEQESSKKQKVEEDKETSKLQSLIEIVYDEEEVSIDAIPLATKPPTIVYWKIHKEGKNSYYQIIRADGSSKMKQNVHIHMLVEKIYPLMAPTIIDMLNKKLQCDHLSEMAYQLLKLITNSSRINEVFGSILLVIMKLLMKKLDDFGDKYQV